jgi:hypothetical protein
MIFSGINYLQWFKHKTPVKYDLCRSGVEPLSLKNLPRVLSLDEIELSGENFYGYPPLLRQIAARYNVSPEEVIITLGTSQAIFLTCLALLSPGDIVLVEHPGYEPLIKVPLALKAQVVPLNREFENGFRIDLNDLQAKLKDKVKLILLTNLHNPSGAYLPVEEIEQLAGLAQENGAWVLVDEIYLDFLPSPEKLSAFGRCDNIIVSASLCKVYGLGDLRCGWLIAPSALAEKIRTILDYIHVEHVFLAERIASLIFPFLPEIRQRNIARREKNFRLVKNFMEEAVRRGWLEWVEPAAGVVCFPRLRIKNITAEQFNQLLREKYDTSVVPGNFFSFSNHFRLGFGGPGDTLKEGLNNLRKALAFLAAS